MKHTAAGIVLVAALVMMTPVSAQAITVRLVINSSDIEIDHFTSCEVCSGWDTREGFLFTWPDGGSGEIELRKVKDMVFQRYMGNGSYLFTVNMRDGNVLKDVKVRLGWLKGLRMGTAWDMDTRDARNSDMIGKTIWRITVMRID